MKTKTHVSILINILLMQEKLTYHRTNNQKLTSLVKSDPLLIISTTR